MFFFFPYGRCLSTGPIYQILIDRPLASSIEMIGTDGPCLSPRGQCRWIDTVRQILRSELQLRMLIKVSSWDQHSRRKKQEADKAEEGAELQWA